MHFRTLKFNGPWKSLLKLTTILFAILLMGCQKNDDTQIADSDLCLAEINGVFEAVVLDEMPTYLDGGEEGFHQAILKEIRYPVEAREGGVEGQAIVTYEITVTGEVENIEVASDPGAGIGQATVEGVRAATQGVVFSPGILDGAPVRVKKELKVDFRLE